MSIYNFPAPKAPGYKKPTSIEDCLPQAKRLVKSTHGRAAMGPVKRGDYFLIVTLPDQDKYVEEAVVQALEEEGAEKVEFVGMDKLFGLKEIKKFSVEDGWKEVEMLRAGTASGAVKRKEALSAEAKDYAAPLRKYLDENPTCTGVFWGIGGRAQRVTGLQKHGDKFRNNWLSNNWEEFFSKAWTYPDELWIEIEKRIIDALGKASAVRITDPEGTHLEYPLTAEDAKRWQKGAGMAGHLLLDPLHATSAENRLVPVSPKVPPVFRDINGVLAGTGNHSGFYPQIEAYFEHGRLVKVKGGGKYGDMIREAMEEYKDVRWPGYPDKGFFWYCDCALCTVVKAFRRTSDMFNSFWFYPNAPERNRAGVFHMGFGVRKHAEDHIKYAEENNLPHGHIHVHNYFATFEIKLQGSDYWYRIVDKGRITAMGNPEIRALAVKYGDPDELLSYDWVPPLPGINCEGDYFNDYAPDPIAYLKKRMKEGKSI